VNLFDLTEEVAVVLGATGVLGGAMAEGLAEACAKVAVLGRNAERGRRGFARFNNREARPNFSWPMPSTRSH
jgi:NAD(P)-dependent dehydrogenase (short-subunit alcohol dehydrogenase family)